MSAEIRHKVRVEKDRCRVVCEACSWFHYGATDSEDRLREIGYQHKRATEMR